MPVPRRRRAARRPLRKPRRVDIEPPFDHPRSSEMQRQLPFLEGTGKRLQRPRVVPRADHREGLPRALERVQVEQHLMPVEQRAQQICNARFVIRRLRTGLGRSKQPVEVSLSLAPHQPPCQRVCHGHHRELPAQQLKRAGIQFGHRTLDADRAAGLVTVDTPQHDQARPGPQGREPVNAEGVVGVGLGAAGCHLAGHPTTASRPPLPCLPPSRRQPQAFSEASSWSRIAVTTLA